MFTYTLSKQDQNIIATVNDEQVADLIPPTLIPRSMIGARELRALDLMQEVKAWPVRVEGKELWLDLNRFKHYENGSAVLVDEEVIYC